MAQTRLINLRLNKSILEQVDEAVSDKKGGYSSRTEFIREATRHLIEEYQKQRAMRLAYKYYGYGRRVEGHYTTDEDIERARESSFKRMEKERFGD